MSPAREARLLQRAVESAPDLPTLPTVVAEIHKALADPRASASAIGDILNRDPALTARTLRLVNSAFYGFPQKITSVTRAIVILGFHKVREVVLTASVFDSFGGKGDGSDKRGAGDKGGAGGFDVTGLWIHSLGTAVASQAVARRLRLPSADDAFVAGLLHDIGKLVHVRHLKPESREVVSRTAAGDTLMLKAEEAVMGVNHATIGHWLVDRWNFPPALVQPIRLHHAPALARDHRDLVHAVHLGDILARALGFGNPGDGRIPEIDPAVWGQNNLSLAVLDQCLGDTLQGFRRCQDFVDLFEGRA